MEVIHSSLPAPRDLSAVPGVDFHTCLSEGWILVMPMLVNPRLACDQYCWLSAIDLDNGP